MEISFMITRDIKMDDREVKRLANALEATLNLYICDTFDYPEDIYASARKAIFKQVVNWMLDSNEYTFGKV